MSIKSIKRHPAIKRLCKMCDDESMRDEIVQAGGVQALLRLCESCADQDTTEENMVVALRASKALYSLSSRLDVAGVLSDFGMGAGLFLPVKHNRQTSGGK